MIRGKTIKVFIVEDSAIVRERLTTLLSEFEEIAIVGHTANPHEATDAIRKLKPDAVILDIRLPGGSGIDVLRTLKQEKPSPHVIMLTNYPYSQYRKKCLEAGADFFFDKSREFHKVTEVL